MIPPARHGGRKRSVNVREVLNGIFYILWTGCQWKALPKDLPPKSTVHDYLELWNWDGTLECIHHALYVAVREEKGREATFDHLVGAGQHRRLLIVRRNERLSRRTSNVLPETDMEYFGADGMLVAE